MLYNTRACGSAESCCLGHLIENGLVSGAKVLGPIVKRCILLCVHALLGLQLQQLIDLKQATQDSERHSCCATL